MPVVLSDAATLWWDKAADGSARVAINGTVDEVLADDLDRCLRWIGPGTSDVTVDLSRAGVGDGSLESFLTDLRSAGHHVILAGILEPGMIPAARSAAESA